MAFLFDGETLMNRTYMIILAFELFYFWNLLSQCSERTLKRALEGITLPLNLLASELLVRFSGIAKYDVLRFVSTVYFCSER